MGNSNGRSRRLLGPGLGLAAVLGCLCLAALAVAGFFYFRSRQAPADVPGVEYVLDVSSRMALPAQNSQSSRLEVARGVLAETLRPTGETADISAGLRVFGSGATSPGCDDTDLLVPPEPDSRPRIAGELEELQAGQSADAALAEAMVAAIGDLADLAGPKSPVVITGGQDSCQTEAGRLIAAEAERAGIELRTFVIGFGVNAGEAQAIKEMVETAGDGLYLDAPDEAALKRAVERVHRYAEEPTEENLAAVSATPAAGAAGPAEAVALPENSAVAYGPQMALDADNRLHLIWWDLSSRPTGDVFYRQRAPDGTWSDSVAITADVPAYVGQYEVHLRLRPDGVPCLFFNALQELKYYLRCREGDAWGELQAVFDATGIKREMQPVFTADGQPYLIYLDGAGAIYAQDAELLSSETGYATDPKLVADGNGRLHAIWKGIGDSYTVEYRSSDDAGQSWSEVETLSGDSSADGPNALEADGAGNVHLLWAGGGTIYHRLWTAGSGWQPATTVTTGNGWPQCNNVALDVDAGGLAHVAWQTDEQLYYARQQEDGSWSVTGRPAGGYCSFSRVPELLVGDDGQVHLVWVVEAGDVDKLFYATMN
jgi:hypothetical protein